MRSEVNWPRADAEGRRLRREWARYLAQFEWDHVGHFTFRFVTCSAWSALNRFEEWANGLCSLAQHPISWIAFPEATHHDRYHLHALMHGTAEIPTVQMLRRWRHRNGLHVLITAYRGQGGIERYLTKGVTPEYSEARWSKTLPPRRAPNPF